MTSILIPVYNYDVRTLVAELLRQIRDVEEECEIICFDDASDDKFLNLNKEIAGLDNVLYTELETNLGRAKIRNRLAAAASGDYLIFIDSDVSILAGDFVRRYIESIGECEVVVGGLAYTPDRPEEQRKLLRWKYGMEREQLSAKTRSENPYFTFLGSNFLITKQLLMGIKFDETFERRYGYEDILLGLKLKDLGINILHIDNPVQHDGLESAEEYLHKVDESVQNLAMLIREDKLDQGVRLMRTYQILKGFGARKLFSICYRKNKDKWIANLKSDNPNIRNLDMYKLGKLIEEMAVK
ncbi:MAG TPA: glycosyltransferase family 2 protein [Flavobacteriales bacterium]|nr:glycosyltransferase family 2 protein [Flavobacteriales bacterium]HIO73450.1 glycosyltransferase family 2 protein [Flavobacteriales bacterium]